MTEKMILSQTNLNQLNKIDTNNMNTNDMNTNQLNTTTNDMNTNQLNTTTNDTNNTNTNTTNNTNNNTTNNTTTTNNTNTNDTNSNINNFKDKYIISLEDQIEMYKIQIYQNKIKLDEMKKKINFYELKLHEKFIVDVTNNQQNNNLTNNQNNNLPNNNLTNNQQNNNQQNDNQNNLSIGVKRRYSEGTNINEEIISRKSSSNISGNSLYSPEKIDQFHFKRRSSTQITLDQQRASLPSIQTQPSTGHRTALPRLSHVLSGSATFGNRIPFSNSAPVNSREFFGHNAPELGHPYRRHSRHEIIEFSTPVLQNQNIYGWKEGPHGMEPLYPVKAVDPACNGCRMRKRKCGREKPHCSHCVHLHRNSTGPNPCTYSTSDKRHINQSADSTDHTNKRQKSDSTFTNPSNSEKKNKVENSKEASDMDDANIVHAVENTDPIETPKPAHHIPAKIHATPSSTHRKNSDGLISPKSSKKLSGGSLESLLHAVSQPPTTSKDVGSTEKELGEKSVSLPYQLSSLNSTQKGLLSPP